MGNTKIQSKAFTRLLSEGVGLILALSTALSPGAAFAGDVSGIAASDVSAGDTAKAAPDVKTMCASIDSALSGDFAKSGFMTVKPECESKSLRQRVTTACQTDRSTELADLTGDAKQAKLDEFCAGGATSLTGSNATYCAIRNAAKGGQAKQYCEAYQNADKAQTGVTITAALDVAAAAACWAETLSMQTLKKALTTARNLQASCVSGVKEENERNKRPSPPDFVIKKKSCKLVFDTTQAMGPGSIFNKSVCGGAAMAAGVGELVQTARVLATGSHSAGDQRIDSDNNVQNRGNFAKVLEVVLSAGASLTAIQYGVCYYSPGAAICKNVNGINDLKAGNDGKSLSASDLYDKIEARNNEANARMKTQQNLETTQQNFVAGAVGLTFAPTVCTLENSVECAKAMKTAQTENTAADKKMTLSEAQARLQTSDDAINTIATAFAARANLAHQAAFLFTGLTAMRSVALLSAGSTKNKAKDILQTMFQGSAGTLSMGAATGANAATNIFSSAGGSTFSTGTGGDPAVKSSAMAADSPERFLAPPGSPVANIAEQIGRQIPPKKLEDAAMAGAAGMGSLVASTATGLGARDTSPIRSAMASMFANLPKDDGAGYSGGGAKSLAKSGGDSSGDLNLKSLFGGGEKEERAGAAAPGLAFRGPASDDIWHSRNPKGNNLFQIVSDRYDNTIRRQDLHP